MKCFAIIQIVVNRFLKGLIVMPFLLALVGLASIVAISDSSKKKTSTLIEKASEYNCIVLEETKYSDYSTKTMIIPQNANELQIEFAKALAQSKA
jgi:hypothetical protein